MRNKPTARKFLNGAGYPASLVLHVGLAAAVLMTWSDTLPPLEDLPVVPVELVTLADKTNVAPMTIKVEAPEPPQAQIDPQSLPEVPPEEVAPVADAKPQPRPKPDKPREKFNIDNIVALLDKKKPPKPQAQSGRTGPQTVKGIGAQDAMTADLRTLLESQVYKCFSPLVGAPNPDKLTAQFHLYLRRDGSIAQAPQLVATGTNAADPFMRATIDAARRAIYTCQPYNLPADRYNQWRDVIITFYTKT